MNVRKLLPIAMPIIASIPLILVYFAHSLILHLLACLWGLFVAVGYFRYIHKLNILDKQRSVGSLQRTAAATLGHHRHDWMNDLQILYGYIQLNKHDKLMECVDRIRERMNKETSISRLGIPSLVFYLQSFREVNTSIMLDVDIQDGLQLGDLLDQDSAEELTAAIGEMIRAYQFAGRSSWGDVIQLSMKMYREKDEIVVVFNQDGNCGNAEMLRRRIEENVIGKRIKTGQTLAEQHSFELRLPC
ncbi:Spo0B domain-containing protein [Paenibacillus shirakamiensis]|nr:Spo0B domain-containing protein [Paenibacillus shirakamiensis]